MNIHTHTPVKHPDTGGSWVLDPKSGKLLPAHSDAAKAILKPAPPAKR